MAELWARDLGDSLLGAVRDPVLPWAATPAGGAGPSGILEWKDLGLSPDMPYFNAGVLLVPLPRWRERAVGARALDLLREHVFLLGDQCALNAVVAGDWVQVEPRWNLQGGHLAPNGTLAWVTESSDDLERAMRDPAVIHFTHFRRRQWQAQSDYPNRALWFEDLDRTAWAGWRPSEPRARGRFHRTASHLKQAAKLLLRR